LPTAVKRRSVASSLRTTSATNGSLRLGLCAMPMNKAGPGVLLAHRRGCRRCVMAFSRRLGSAGRRQIIDGIKSIEAKYPGLEDFMIHWAEGLPPEEFKEQLRWFAKDVMPAFNRG